MVVVDGGIGAGIVDAEMVKFGGISAEKRLDCGGSRFVGTDVEEYFHRHDLPLAESTCNFSIKSEMGLAGAKLSMLSWALLGICFSVAFCRIFRVVDCWIGSVKLHGCALGF